MASAAQAVVDKSHVWRFFRSGGLDQVRIETGADVLSLDQLDQKLWAALSCPTIGLEIDHRTLDCIDTDRDGRIRAPDILAATRWACAMLTDADSLTKSSPSLHLSQINTDTLEGKQLLASAQQILHALGKPNADEITADDTADQTRIFSKTRFNGDGVVPGQAADDNETALVINDAAKCIGVAVDRSGLPGITNDIWQQFWLELVAYDAWWQRAEAESSVVFPLGDNTHAAAKSFAAVKPKIDDYFARCRLTAFDARAASHLNRADKEYELLASALLSANADEVAGFPLAKIDAVKPLDLNEGINPAWAVAIQKFATQVVTPLLGKTDRLTDVQWTQIVKQFAAYEAWQSAKAGTKVEVLGLSRIRDLLASDANSRINALFEQESRLTGEFKAISAVDKLVLLHRDLFSLLNNFVAFRDFYSGKAKAIFQIGSLYLDGRSCELCIAIDDIAKHSTLASLSRMYLVYCNCTRRGSTEKMTIAAAVMAGDADNLLVGRNGLFYDRQGRDWDATIVKILEHPISIRQAFWSPYKRIGRMVSEQIEKMAASRDKAAQDNAAAGIADSSQKLDAGKTVGQQAFDIGKFAGIFAAIGLAVGALGTALAAMATGLLGLSFWQMPLAIVGAILLVSGPSMVIAWMKLRHRNLGPILDANGWAVNARAKVNIAFGHALTKLARLPPGAQRSFDDPFAEKKRPWRTYIFLLVVIIGAIAYLRYYSNVDSTNTKEPPPATQGGG